MGWAVHVMRNVSYVRFWCKTQKEIRPLGRIIRRLGDNIKMDLGEIWTRLIWLRIRTGGRLL
jgi:hypothetical protein